MINPRHSLLPKLSTSLPVPAAADRAGGGSEQRSRPATASATASHYTLASSANRMWSTDAGRLGARGAVPPAPRHKIEASTQAPSHSAARSSAAASVAPPPALDKSSPSDKLAPPKPVKISARAQGSAKAKSFWDSLRKGVTNLIKRGTASVQRLIKSGVGTAKRVARNLFEGIRRLFGGSKPGGSQSTTNAYQQTAQQQAHNEEEKKLKQLDKEKEKKLQQLKEAEERKRSARSAVRPPG
jgi:hypothetical protein